MKMKKTILFTITLLVTTLAYSQIFTENYFTYQVTSSVDYTVKITDYDVTGGTAITIPASVTNTATSITYTVTEVGGLSLKDKGLTSAIIPNSITIIELSAFSDNNLTSIVIPDSVTYLGPLTFQNNQITTAVLSNGLTSIPSQTFFNNMLTSIIIPNTITSIGSSAFRDNVLTTISIPDSVTSIAANAFSNNQITTLTLSNNLTSIGQSAFRNNLLTTVTLPDSLINMDSGAFSTNDLTSVTFGVNLQEIESAVFEYNNLTSINIPDNVTTIDLYAFRNNMLTDIIIPSNVTTIGFRAFRDNPLVSVTSLNTVPPTITTGGVNDSFATNRSSIDLFIPAGTLGAYVTDAGALWTGFNTTSETALSVDEFDLASEVSVITTENSILIRTFNTAHLQEYTLYNISGIKLHNGTANKIITSNYASGIYLLKLATNKGNLIKKIAIH